MNFRKPFTALVVGSLLVGAAVAIEGGQHIEPQRYEEPLQMSCEVSNSTPTFTVANILQDMPYVRLKK